MKHGRTHRESYEQAVSPRVRELAAGVGLPLPTWAEDLGPQKLMSQDELMANPGSAVDSHAEPDRSIVRTLSATAAAFVRRALDQL